MLKQNLKRLKKKLAEEFGEQLSDDENEDNSETETDNLYCVACNKIFKTPKAFQNHELSKKHRENVEKIKETMLDNADECEEVSDDLSDLEITVDKQDTHEDSHGELSNIESEDEDIGKKQKKKQRKSKNVIQVNLSDQEDFKVLEQKENLNTSDVENGFDCSTSKKQKRKNKKSSTKADKTADKNLNNSETENYIDALQNGTNQEDSGSNAKKEKVIKSKKTKNKQDKKETETPKVDVDTSHCCVICKADFPSKNKLFDHLKKTGHSVYLPQNIKIVKNKKKTVKEK